MEMNDVAAMEVLKEIKSLMDSKLGDRLAPSEDEGGLEISSVNVSGEDPLALDGKEAVGEAMGMPPDDSGMSPEEMEQLKAVRSKMG